MSLDDTSSAVTESIIHLFFSSPACQFNSRNESPFIPKINSDSCPSTNIFPSFLLSPRVADLVNFYHAVSSPHRCPHSLLVPASTPSIEELTSGYSRLKEYLKILPTIYNHVRTPALELLVELLDPPIEIPDGEGIGYQLLSRERKVTGHLRNVFQARAQGWPQDGTGGRRLGEVTVLLELLKWVHLETERWDAVANLVQLYGEEKLLPSPRSIWERLHRGSFLYTRSVPTQMMYDTLGRCPTPSIRDLQRTVVRSPDGDVSAFTFCPRSTATPRSRLQSNDVSFG